MNRWLIRNKLSLHNKIQPCIAKSAKIDSKAEIKGKVFIGDGSSVGHSKIQTENGHQINIGKETTIKDCVTITTKAADFELKLLEKNSIKDIFIGNKVFISSEVSVHGPSIISDGTFVGYHSKIVNSKIGENCIIEDKAVIKNVNIPPDTFIPAKSIIDSNERLISLLNGDLQGNYREFDFIKESFVKAG